LVSIHDVMPETLGAVRELIDLCRQHRASPVTLLVVPGRSWTRDGLQTLRDWQAEGHELAGHGWHHRCRSIRGLRHRLHSWLISRDVAEHLALSSEQIVRLMERCGSWFGEQGLGVPSLYVPPAWALGPVDHARLRHVSFASVEVLGGVLSTRDGSLWRLPLVGFEADTRMRAAALRGWNRLNRRLASRGTRPLRIAIHPHDHRLRLHDDLRRSLERPLRTVPYGDLTSRPDPEKLSLAETDSH
jgi:hypothetical protein